MPTRWFSRWLDDKNQIIRQINAAVWDSEINMLRYAAFFRFCKQANPVAWKRFLDQLSNVSLQPAVTTPDYIDGPETEDFRRLLEQIRKHTKKE